MKAQGVTANGYIRIGYLAWTGWETPKAEIYDFIATQNGLLITGDLVPDGEMGALRFEC